MPSAATNATSSAASPTPVASRSLLRQQEGCHRTDARDDQERQQAHRGGGPGGRSATVDGVRVRLVAHPRRTVGLNANPPPASASASAARAASAPAEHDHHGRGDELFDRTGRPAEAVAHEQGGIDQQDQAGPDADHVAAGHDRGDGQGGESEPGRAGQGRSDRPGRPVRARQKPTTAAPPASSTSAGQPMRDPPVGAAMSDLRALAGRDPQRGMRPGWPR